MGERSTPRKRGLNLLRSLFSGRQKAAQAVSVADSSRGWYPLVREPFAGAWQRNLEVSVETALNNPFLFRCISLISSDIAKMRCRLMQQDSRGIWHEVESPAFSPVLRKPNRFQTQAQFFRSWVHSKLMFGNTYVLKARDGRGVVVALYVLDPTRVTPLVAPDGSVFYQLSSDNLAGLQAQETVPASEIAHDRTNTLFHPLVGLSPIYACGLSALQGVEIQRTATLFFQNGATPGGVLTHPEFISQEQAEEYSRRWKEKFGGNNRGSIAVLGNGLTYQPIEARLGDAQTVEQLKLTGEIICGTFGVPPYKAGIGTLPVNANVEALTQQYYGDALQPHIEDIEACLDEALGIGWGIKTSGNVYGVEFDLDGLIRMDTATQIKTLVEAVGGKLMTPDEGRARINLGHTEGGDAVYAQQQDFSLAALAERDRNKPFAKPDAPPAAEPAPTPEAANDMTDEDKSALAGFELERALKAK